MKHLKESQWRHGGLDCKLFTAKWLAKLSPGVFWKMASGPSKLINMAKEISRKSKKNKTKHWLTSLNASDTIRKR